MRACSTKTDSTVTGIFSPPYKFLFWVTKCKTSDRTSNINDLICTMKANLCRCGYDPCNNLMVLNLFDRKMATSQLKRYLRVAGLIQEEEERTLSLVTEAKTCADNLIYNECLEHCHVALLGPSAG